MDAVPERDTRENAERTLNDLREHLALPAAMPRVSNIHPLALALDSDDLKDAEVIFCVHDDANEQKHHITYPARVMDTEQPERIRKHCAFIISASYN